MNKSEAIEFAKSQQEIFGGKMGEFLKFVEKELTQTNAPNTLNALDCDDTISRVEAIEAINNVLADYLPILPLALEPIPLRCGMAINALPSAERRGKWIHDGKDFPHGCDWIHCSVCGKRGINVPADLTNYCPNCGAKMITDKDDTQ